MRRPPVISSCGEHTVGGLSYLPSHDDAERRHKRGERQGQCEECGRWAWPYPPLTQREIPNPDQTSRVRHSGGDGL